MYDAVVLLLVCLVSLTMGGLKDYAMARLRTLISI